MRLKHKLCFSKCKLRIMLQRHHKKNGYKKNTFYKACSLAPKRRALLKRHTIIIIILCYNHKYEVGARQSEEEGGRSQEIYKSLYTRISRNFLSQIVAGLRSGIQFAWVLAVAYNYKNSGCKGFYSSRPSTFCCVLSYLFLHPFEGVVRIPNWGLTPI